MKPEPSKQRPTLRLKNGPTEQAKVAILVARDSHARANALFAAMLAPWLPKGKA
jgi:hypothetical protein